MESGESTSVSLDPLDSVSQSGAGPSGPTHLSTFLHQFSSFFGFGDGPPPSSFKDMVSNLVVEQVQKQFDGHMSSLPLSAPVSVSGMAVPSAYHHSLLDVSRGAMALSVDVPEDGNRGREASVVRDRVGQCPPLSDTPPRTGTRPRSLRTARRGAGVQTRGDENAGFL